MPMYDYKCDRCGYEVALIRPSWNDATAPMVHEHCGGTLLKQPSAPSFRLVGSGFHQNDYPKKDQ